MDHHCPWINNCVGYYTLKPFLLFLTYVTVQCFLTCYWMYKSARVHKMEHVSFIALIPAPQLKMSMKLLFSNSEEKKEIQVEAERAFKQQVQFEKDHPSEILSFRAFYDTIIGSEFGNDNPFKSFSAFFDILVIVATLALGCYTFGLFCTTVYYARKQSSMVDDHKKSKFLSLTKADQKAL
mgnify:CR=1 FL=1